jgi:hypothetical protein
MWKRIVLIFSKLGDFLIDFLESGSSVTICEVGPFALELVLRAEDPRLVIGNSKRKYVTAELKNVFPAMAMNEINAAVEIAVILMKAKGLERKTATNPEPVVNPSLIPCPS